MSFCHKSIKTHCLAIAKKYHFETIAASQFHSYSKGSARLVFFSISCTFSTQSRLKISTQNHWNIVQFSKNFMWLESL